MSDQPDGSDSASSGSASVLTSEQQAALTPDSVRDELVAGNERFASGSLTVRDHLGQLSLAEAGQHPKAIVLSCVDSRVPVEMVFDCGIGDLFVTRVAGNNVNADILGSMEYACRVAGSKLVVVLGHQHCGAVKSAIDGVELGNITELLSKITPSVEATSNERDSGPSTSDDADFVAAVTEANVRDAMLRIRTESSILADMEDAGEIGIVGAVYNLASGRVSFLDAIA